MTADQDLGRSLPSPAGLFQAAGQVIVVHSGSALALLDLERGLVFATTPEAAEAWRMLVDGRKADPEGHAAVAEVVAALADVLLQSRLIEPRAAEPVNREEEGAGEGGP